MLKSAEETLKKYSSEYQQHLTIRNKSAKILQHQRNILHFKTIPKRYLPATPEIVTANSILSNDFQTEYQELFFQHLNKIISHNTITLELENARLNKLIVRTETHLSSLQASAETTEQLRRHFYTQNNIPTTHKTSSMVHQDTTELIPTQVIATTANPSIQPAMATRANPSTRPVVATTANPSTRPAIANTSTQLAIAHPSTLLAINTIANPSTQQPVRFIRPREGQDQHQPNSKKMKKLQDHFLSLDLQPKPPT